MRNLTINTTAFEEEDFMITTDLTDAEIREVLMPILNAERNGDEYYDNDDLVDALLKAYPGRIQVLVDEYLKL